MQCIQPRPHDHDSVAADPVFLRNGIAYNLARMLLIRLDELHDDEVLFHFDTVARHNATTVKQGKGCCIAEGTAGCGSGKWLYRRLRALSTIGGDLYGDGWLAWRKWVFRKRAVRSNASAVSSAAWRGRSGSRAKP